MSKSLVDCKMWNRLYSPFSECMPFYKLEGFAAQCCLAPPQPAFTLSKSQLSFRTQMSLMDGTVQNCVSDKWQTLFRGFEQASCGLMGSYSVLTIVSLAFSSTKLQQNSERGFWVQIFSTGSKLSNEKQRLHKNLLWVCPCPTNVPITYW